MRHVIVCSNDETLLSGYDVDPLVEGDVTQRMVRAACRVISLGTDDNLDTVLDSNFHAWNGGRHSRYQCGRIISGKPWGYTTGRVACHEENVPEWLREVMDVADQAMVDIASDPENSTIN